MKYLKIYTTLLGLLTTQAMTAQSFSEVMQRMQRTYAEAEKLHVVMQLQAYASKDDNKPFLSEQAELKKAGEQYYYRLGHNEVLLNDAFMLSIQRDQKQILAQTRSGEKVNTPPVPWMDLDSLKHYDQWAEYMEHDATGHRYKLTLKQGEMNQVDVWLNETRTAIRKLAYHYNTGSYVTITFERMEAEPHFEPNTFSEKQFVQQVDGEWQPVLAYNDYQVVMY